MNTSDLVSIGSRPLLPKPAPTFTKETKEQLLAKLAATFTPATPIQTVAYETYQFEFPGDRTYSRYISNKQNGSAV